MLKATDRRSGTSTNAGSPILDSRPTILGNFEEDVLLAVSHLGGMSAHVRAVHAEMERDREPFSEGATAHCHSTLQVVCKGFFRKIPS